MIAFLAVIDGEIVCRSYALNVVEEAQRPMLTHQCGDQRRQISAARVAGLRSGNMWSVPLSLVRVACGSHATRSAMMGPYIGTHCTRRTAAQCETRWRHRSTNPRWQTPHRRIERNMHHSHANVQDEPTILLMGSTLATSRFLDWSCRKFLLGHPAEETSRLGYVVQ